MNAQSFEAAQQQADANYDWILVCTANQEFASEIYADTMRLYYEAQENEAEHGTD